MASASFRLFRATGSASFGKDLPHSTAAISATAGRVTSTAPSGISIEGATANQATSHIRWL